MTGETVVLTNWGGASCTAGCLVATGTGTGTVGGAGLTAGREGTAGATKATMVFGGSGAAATAVGAPDACFASLSGFPKVPAGKKNPGGGPTDATVGRDAATGWALPQPCSTQITV